MIDFNYVYVVDNTQVLIPRLSGLGDKDSTNFLAEHRELTKLEDTEILFITTHIFVSTKSYFNFDY